MNPLGPMLMLCEEGKLHGRVLGKETDRTRLPSTPPPATKRVKLFEETVQNTHAESCQSLLSTHRHTSTWIALITYNVTNPTN